MAQTRADRIAAAQPDPASNELAWGEWVADVLAPPENQRHLYQQRLADARSLAGPPCTPAGTAPPPAPLRLRRRLPHRLTSSRRRFG